MTEIDNRQSTIANPRACLIFLGCPKNQVDSEHVLGSLIEAGYSLTTEPRSADLIVITTCAFLQSAVRESEAAIEEALRLKQRSPGNPETDIDATKARKTRNGPVRTESTSFHPASCFRGSLYQDSGSTKVVVAGCLVERYGNSLKRKFPAVDLWVRLADMPRIGQLTANRQSPFASRHEESSSCTLHLASCSSSPRVLSTPPHFAYLKIADGCDNRCSYCMIPDIRGPFCSRPMRDIVAEAHDLARAGVKELILVAQDTTLYGTDLRSPEAGVHHQDTKTQSPKRLVAPESALCHSCLRGLTSVSGSVLGQPRLAELLDKLGRIDGIRWLRLMYTHPAHLTEDVVDQFASNLKLCRYIDLPIQHVADHLLDKMNRGYTREDVELLIESLRAIPDMHVRTTIIVGLPGETERDFDELLAFVRAARFDRLSCYAYSPEPGTKAERLPGQVSPTVKKERVRRLMLAQAAISRANLKKLIGRKLTVLVDALTDNRQVRQERQGRMGPKSEVGGPDAGTANCHLEYNLGRGTRLTGHSRAARHDSPGIGRTQWDAPEIDGVVKLSGRKASPGRFVTALVTDSSTHDLLARVL